MTAATVAEFLRTRRAAEPTRARGKGKGSAAPRDEQATSGPASPASPADAYKRVRADPELRLIEVGDMRTATLAPPRFVFAPIIPRGHVTLLGGHGGAGKSMLALTLAAHASTGRDFAGFTCESCRVLFVSLEDAADLVRYRLALIVEAYGLGADIVAASLRIVDGASVDASLAVEENEFGNRNLDPTKALVQVSEWAAGCGLLVVDNASDGYDADANNPRMVRTFVRRMLGKIARDNDAAVLLLAHIDKTAARHGSAGNSYTGTTAWHNSARSRLALVEHDGALELVHEKANLSARAATVRLVRGEHGVIFPAGTVCDPGASTAALLEKADADSLLAALRAADALQVPIPTGRNGPSNAQRVLETIAELPAALHGAKGRARFWAALGRLQHDGRARIEEYRNADHKLRRRIVPLPTSAAANPPTPPCELAGGFAASPPISAELRNRREPAGTGGAVPCTAAEYRRRRDPQPNGAAHE